MTAPLLAQQAMLEQWLQQRPRRVSALAFVNIFLWQEHFEFEFKEINGRLCVFASNKVGTFLYFPPLGSPEAPGKDYDSATVEACFALMREKNHGRGVSRIENVAAEEMALFPEEKYSAFLKGYEYVYYRPDLAAFAGEDYKSKRHDHNLFIKNHAAHYGAFTVEMTTECLALYDRWAADRRKTHDDAVYVQMLEENRGVHRLGMEYFKALGLTGRVVTVDGKIAAYTFGYALTLEIFCVLFEVADFDFRGLPTYIFAEFCRDAALAQYKFINCMDDFGVKNLEQTKLSFRPAALIPVYAVSERT